MTHHPLPRAILIRRACPHISKEAHPRPNLYDALSPRRVDHTVAEAWRDYTSGNGDRSNESAPHLTQRQFTREAGRCEHDKPPGTIGIVKSGSNSHLPFQAAKFAEKTVVTMLRNPESRLRSTLMCVPCV